MKLIEYPPFKVGERLVSGGRTVAYIRKITPELIQLDYGEPAGCVTYTYPSFLIVVEGYLDRAGLYHNENHRISTT